MCRWIVLVTPSGISIKLADILSKPAHSLVRQSHDASYHPGFSGRNNASLNADGFGVSYYTRDGRAFIYKSIYPAWSDPNLRELIESLESSCIFGHVRAASPGSVVSYENCHPFKFGKLVLMHNGHVEGFTKLRRALLGKLTDEAFKCIKGLTDSEHVFALLLSHLQNPGRTSPFAPEELSTAIEATICDILHLLKDADVTGGFTSLNLALTDGVNVVCTRYCDKFPSIPPPSLYFAFPTYAELQAELDGVTEDRTGPGDGSMVTTTVSTTGAASSIPLSSPESSHTILTSARSVSSTSKPKLADMVAALTAYSAEGGVDAHGVDSLRWSRDEAYLASTIPTASERALLVASEPCTVGSRIMWLTLPANAILIHSKGQAPNLKHLTVTLPGQDISVFGESVGGAGAKP